jgi:hemerythrin-like domain-containing protein
MPTRRAAKPKSARSTPRDAISMLKNDHKRVQDLLEKLEGASSRGTKSRDSLLEQVEQEVKAHSMIEEEIFYPAFRDAVRKKDEKQLFFEATEEHHVVDVVMSEFHDGEPDQNSFAARCKVLKDLIEHHIEEEEREMFPAAKKVFGKDGLVELGERLEERKQEIMADAGSPVR